MNEKTISELIEFAELLERHPKLTNEQLAKILNVTERTVTRNRKALKLLLAGEEVPGTDSDSGRKIAILLWISQRGSISEAQLKSILNDNGIVDIETNQKDTTIDRALRELERQKVIKKTKSSLKPNDTIWVLGERILTNLNLTEEEITYLTGYLEDYAQKVPLGKQLESILTKICLEINDSSWDKMIERSAKLHQRRLYKGCTFHAEKETVELTVKLLELIDQRWILKLSYISPKLPEVLEPEVQPLGIVFNGIINEWYLAAINTANEQLELFRFDRLRNYEQIRQETTEFPPLPEKLWLSWGTEMGQQYQVKVRFFHEGNVCDKVRLESAKRKSAQLASDENGNLILTDTIMGLEEFRHWLRQFGASAEVLEPKELRQLMCESSKRVLQNYPEAMAGEK